MHQFAGPVALVLAGLWLAYLVPYKLRHRQQLLESRADDRYSEALRVVAVTARARRGRGARSEASVSRVDGRAHAGTTGLLTPGSGLAAIAGSRTGGDTVDRPHATPERITAEASRRAASMRAARAASVARRAAGARRRATLAAVLVVATAVCWAVVGLVPAAQVLVGIVPTVLLAAVLVAGRSAVVAGARNDERLARQIAASDELAANPRSGATRTVTPATTAPTAVKAKPATAPVRVQSAPTPRVTGRAVHPSDASTEVFAAIVADHGEKGISTRHATGQVPVVARAGEPAAAWTRPPKASSADDDGWAPVPVPRPTYAMKAAAPHREPVPLGEVEASTSMPRAAASAPADASPAAVSEPDEPRTPAVPVEPSASIDLNAVLAKRRASGQ